VCFPCEETRVHSRYTGSVWSLHGSLNSCLRLTLLPLQGARCGDGLRYRNVTCFVSDGSGREVGSPADEELCWDLEEGVDGDKLVVLEEVCTVPCPGEDTLRHGHATGRVCVERSEGTTWRRRIGCLRKVP